MEPAPFGAAGVAVSPGVDGELRSPGERPFEAELVDAKELFCDCMCSLFWASAAMAWTDRWNIVLENPQ